jgi:MoaA/NifB/PqqE/SkfB family radical SAM enzyme
MKEKYPIGKVEVLLDWVCNQNCIFCSVGHKLRCDPKIKSFDEVKKDIDWAKQKGASDIAFSGGEPTILNYLLDAIDYAKKLGFKLIQIQSNGMMFSYKEFTRKVVDAGVNSVMISVHGHTSQVHDFLVGVKGAFEKSAEGLENLKEMRKNKEIIDLRTSTVATKFNYRFLPEIAKFLLQFNLDFLHIGPAIIDGNAYTNKGTVIAKMSQIAPYAKEACDLAIKAGVQPALYSFPCCLMSGYERFIAELATSDTILKMPSTEEGDVTVSIQEHRHDDRVKMKSCKNCKYYDACVGVWKKYVRMFGFDEFKPVVGEKVDRSSLFGAHP